MTDLRYDRAGELTARDEVLRVRTFHHPDGRTEADPGVEGSHHALPRRLQAARGDRAAAGGGSADPGRLLAALGYQPAHAIEREVEVYRAGRARPLRLETYPRMDVLLEVEGEPAAIEQAIVASGIPRGEFTAEPLAEFVRRFEERSGEPALLAATPRAVPGAPECARTGVPPETWEVPELGPSLGRLERSAARCRRRARSARGSTTSGSDW